MTDKKYTNEEIEKALSLCGRTTEVVYCDQCPLCGEYECNRIIKVLAFDIINRQKAEIERLKEKKSKLENKINEIYPLVMQLPNAMQQIKAEACKEFANKLEEEYGIFTPLGVNWIEEVKAVRVSDIDKILKETVGEDNDR